MLAIGLRINPYEYRCPSLAEPYVWCVKGDSRCRHAPDAPWAPALFVFVF
jgi:hypothetical protein